ncbi:transporter [Bradyrhizobium sp.]|uniref:transporter n=1 Tax=Bradyrhizobium sp. TaxID=376 RepID=UPI003C6FAA2D
MSEARADACPTATAGITTDRPDVTNSSIVVPTGSLQNENGINFTARDSGQVLDGTNTRWRLGVAPCLELLADLPSYSANLHAPGSSGFSDLAPAVKWQVSPVPGTVDLSIVAGAALPTGAAAIAGRGAQPYLQFPWSWELHDGWSVSGMFTEFFRPSDPTTGRISEATFVLEQALTEKFSVFGEYVGDYPDNAGPSHLFNSGAMYRLGQNQQIDIHLAFGLNHNAPNTIVGVGYSYRFDGLFGRLPR